MPNRLLHGLYTRLLPFLLLACAATLMAATTTHAVAGHKSTAIAVDDAGNHYVVGHAFTGGGDLDYNPGQGTDRQTGFGNTDCFVTRFNADGSYAWTTLMGGSQNETGNALILVGETLYLCGNTISDDFAVGSGNGGLDTTGSKDGFIVALHTSNGEVRPGFGNQGRLLIGGSDDDDLVDVAEHDGTLYVVGTLLSNDFGIGPDLGSGPLSIINNRADDDLNDTDGVVIAVDALTGAPLSGFSVDGMALIAGTGNDFPVALTIHDGVIYTTGLTGSTDLGIDSDAGSGLDLPNDGFICALDTGTAAPFTAFAGNGWQSVRTSPKDIASAASGVYVLGSGKGSARIANGASIANQGQTDVAIAAIGHDGQPLIGFGSGGLIGIGSGDFDQAFAIAVHDGRVACAGSFRGTPLVITGAAIGHPEDVELEENEADFIVFCDAETGAGVESYGEFGLATEIGGLDLAWSGEALYTTAVAILTPSRPNRAPSIDAITVDGAAVDIGDNFQRFEKSLFDNITFTAEGSDPDGDDLTYQWDFKDSYSATGATVVHAYQARGRGQYDVLLTVSDGITSVSATIVITIPYTGNQTPWVTPELDSEILATGETLHGSAIAGDNDSEDTVSVWWEVQGIRTDGLNMTHVFSIPGTYEVAVFVSDGTETKRELLSVTVTGEAPDRTIAIDLAPAAGVTVSIAGDSFTPPPRDRADLASDQGHRVRFRDLGVVD